MGWHIERNPKPIPDRSHDYDFVHDDYDGADGGNGLAGTAASFEDACQQIADIEAERTYQDILDERDRMHKKLKCDALEAQRHAEMTAHIYACNCEIGPERERAFQVFENIRTAGRVAL